MKKNIFTIWKINIIIPKKLYLFTHSSFFFLNSSHTQAHRHTKSQSVSHSLYFFVPGCSREHTAASLLVFISPPAITSFSPATSISGLYIVQNTPLPPYLPQVLIEQPGMAFRPARRVLHCANPLPVRETNRAAVRWFLKKELLKGFLSGLVSRLGHCV